MRNLTRALLFFIVYIAGHTAGFAQETTSQINGVVTDNQKPLAGASITALHQPTGTKYTTLTRSDGRYNLPNLKVGGPYTITVTYVGFQEEKKENVTLLLGQDYQADFALVGQSAILENVVVRTSRQDKIFNNSRTGSQEIINRTQLERLPTVNRSLQDFTKLTPSANGLSFGGRSSSYNNITVDGANFNNAFGLSGTLGGQTNSQPISLDAIEQIQVNLSPYDARQGGFSGAGVNSVTRSGTNKFRGSVYTYLKGPGTQGYKVRTVTVPKTDFNYNLSGIAVGGPIVKNKAFFFISAEQEKIEQPATSYVASNSTRQPGGNVSLANEDTLTQLKQFLIQNYGYDPGEFQGYTYRTHSDKITARVDWNINDKNTFTIKYNYLKSYKDIPASNSGAPGGNRQPGSTSLPFSGSGYTINNNFNIVIAELNSRFSNKASNKLQVGFTALRDFRGSLSGGEFPLVDIMNGLGQTYTTFGYEPFTYNNLLNTDVIQFADIFTFYKGSHEITLGTQNYYKKFKNGFAPNFAGAYRFNTLSDFYNSASNGVANSSLYTLQYVATKDGSFPFAVVKAFETGFFAQDKWRIQNNFTLTYGFRIDLPIFSDDFESNPYADDLVFRDGKKYDVGQKPGNNALFSPRVGFNWDAFRNQKLQVRGGVGVFAGPPPFVWISNQASNNGVQFGSFSSTTPYAFNPDINAYRPASVSENTSYNLVFTDENFKYPSVLKASLAADIKLPADIVATVEGTYSKDINNVYFQNVNLPETGVAFQGSDPRLRYDSTRIYGGKPVATVTNPNITNAILMTNTNKGSVYMLTVQFQKNLRNLSVSAAYTYTRAKTVNDGGSIAASNWRDRPVQGDPNANELGFANFYQPHRVIASAFYRKEYAKYFATSVGFIFEAAPAGVGSYTYNGDVNNDGTGGNNDLIYIPKDQSDIFLVPVANGAPVNGVTDTRTASQIWVQLNNFINQDPYMSSHRGQIAERNGVVLPFYKRLDFNFTQDFYLYTGKDKDKHTLRFTFDIINAGNLLNKNWGVYKIFTNKSFLKYEGLDATSGKPKYSFPYLDAANQVPLVNSFTDDTSLFSRWQAQFGLRYIFN